MFSSVKLLACRWKATPLRLEQWKAWFDEQTALAGANLDKGLYISLRLDGRVRGSGQGPPPWQRLIAQLAPLEGAVLALEDMSHPTPWG